MNNLSLSEQEKTLHSSFDEYGKLVVKEQGQIRSLYFGDEKKQSTIFTPHPSVLILHYTQVMMSSLLFEPEPKKILLLGLGGGSLVHFLLKAAPFAQIEVVELRPDVIELSETYFELPIDSERLVVHCDEACSFMSKKMRDNAGRYDMILVDIFDNDGPSTLNADVDFLTSCKSLLNDSGVISFNLWNRKIDLYTSLYKKYKQIFAGKLIELKLGRLDSNVVLFGFSPNKKSCDVNLYKTKAENLKQQHGIDFPYFLNLMQKQNFSFMSRVKKLIWA